MFRQNFLIFLMLTLSFNANAFLETVDTGELVGKDSYRAYGGINAIFNDVEGVNVMGRISTGILEESEVQLELGFGSVDFNVGAYYKWVPIPDYENQPAVGIKIGGHYGRIANNDLVNISGVPLISKKFKTELGDFSPYGALPISLHFISGKTNLGLAANLGTQWTTLRWDDIHFFLDIRLELIETFSAVSVGVAHSF